MRFVDLASRYRSTILVTNISGRGEPVDGKSAMQMMLLEATQGSIVRIEARGDDAEAAAAALAALVESSFAPDAAQPPKPSAGHGG
jgi:phosphotransferase system HPr (HPr) family protein